jgi:uncharacterized protein
MRRCNTGGELIRRGRSFLCYGVSTSTLSQSTTTTCQWKTNHNSYNSNVNRSFSWEGHGTDLLSDSLAHNAGVPKIVLRAHGFSGFDVVNLVKNMDPSDQELQKSGGVIHMAGSILVFPEACFLWNVRNVDELSVASLAPVQLYRPKLEYLFLGSVEPITPSRMQQLRQELAVVDSDNGLVIESMDLVRDRHGKVSQTLCFFY